MKVRIQHLSPHQNGKVVSIIAGFISALFSLPIFFIFIVSGAHTEQGNEAVFMLLLMPLFYLIFTYIAVVLTCFVYNWLHKYIGGLELDLDNDTQHQHHDT